MSLVETNTYCETWSQIYFSTTVTCLILRNLGAYPHPPLRKGMNQCWQQKLERRKHEEKHEKALKMVAFLPIDDVYLDRHGCLTATAAASRGLPGCDSVCTVQTNSQWRLFYCTLVLHARLGQYSAARVLTPSGGFSTAHCSVCTVQHLVWVLCMYFCLPTEHLCLSGRLKWQY